jgi:hypothetical protein
MIGLTGSFRSRDFSVDIATGYGLDGQVSIPGRGNMFFSPPQRQNLLWGPPGLPYNGYPGLFPPGGGVKRSGREADHPSPSSAEVRDGGDIPLLPTRLHGVVLN